MEATDKSSYQDSSALSLENIHNLSLREERRSGCDEFHLHNKESCVDYEHYEHASNHDDNGPIQVEGGSDLNMKSNSFRM